MRECSDVVPGQGAAHILQDAVVEHPLHGFILSSRAVCKDSTVYGCLSRFEIGLRLLPHLPYRPPRNTPERVSAKSAAVLDQRPRECRSRFAAPTRLLARLALLTPRATRGGAVWWLLGVISLARDDFMGIPATGNQVTMEAIHIYRLSEGKLAEHWVARDDLGMIRQLGVIPTPEQSEESGTT